ncbi:MAG: GTP-binding protein [Promethearchaeota archaeon]
MSVSQNGVKKPSIALTIIGHVDHGKSTSMGRFLVDLGVIDPRTFEKLQTEASMLQMDSWAYAYILDSLPEERERGLTSDIALRPFETEKYRIMLIDAPGHRDFVKNMIRGAAQADACILFVSAAPSDLKAGVKVGDDQTPGGQTREHAILASVLGIEQIIIAINKMDLVDYQKESYTKAVKTIIDLFKEIKSPWAYKLDNIPFIPISGLEGENLCAPSQKMPWWSGGSLLDSLNSLIPPSIRSEYSLRLVIQDTYEMPGVGVLLDGRVLSGRLGVNEKVLLLPINESGVIKDLWVDEDDINITEAFAGDHVTLTVRGVEKENLHSGIVLSDPNDPPSVPAKIVGRILLLDSGKMIIPGALLALHCGTAQVSARINKILKIEHMSPKHKKVRREIEGRITFAFPGELIQLEIEPLESIVAETYENHAALGRVVLRDMGVTVGVGIITHVE